MPRSSLSGVGASLPPGVSAACATSFGSLMAAGGLLSQYHHSQQQQQLLVNNNNNTLFATNNMNTISIDSASKNAAAFAFLSDHGLLQDILPSHMLKEE